MRYQSLIGASVILGLMTGSIASAEKARTNLGVLTCTVGPGDGRPGARATHCGAGCGRCERGCANRKGPSLLDGEAGPR